MIPFRVVGIEVMEKHGRKFSSEYADLFHAIANLGTKDCVEVNCDILTAKKLYAAINSAFAKKREKENKFFTSCRISKGGDDSKCTLYIRKSHTVPGLEDEK